MYSAGFQESEYPNFLIVLACFVNKNENNSSRHLKRTVLEVGNFSVVQCDEVFF